MILFDLYRSGYEKGYNEGKIGKMRNPVWLIFIKKPLLFFPFVDRQSYINGYQQGYHDGTKYRNIFH